MGKSWLIGLAFIPQVSLAIPVEFSFTTTIGTSAIAGVSAGDAFSFNVIADNGGTSLVSQDWLVSDVISAQSSVGSYSAEYIAPFFPTAFAFQTDAAGTLIGSSFSDIDGNNQDIFGVGGLVAIGSDSIRDFFGNLAIFEGCEVPPGTGLNCKDDVRLWDVSLVNTVPEPAPWVTLAIGMATLVLQRKQRRAQA